MLSMMLIRIKMKCIQSQCNFLVSRCTSGGVETPKRTKNVRILVSDFKTSAQEQVPNSSTTVETELFQLSYNSLNVVIYRP